MYSQRQIHYEPHDESYCDIAASQTCYSAEKAVKRRNRGPPGDAGQQRGGHSTDHDHRGERDNEPEYCAIMCTRVQDKPEQPCN